MTGTETRWRGAEAAQLSWSRGTPRSSRFDDTYFSATDGAEESRQVFVAGNHLPDRWANSSRTTIAETGFGTGLNFLETWRSWREAEAPGQLHYLSIEGFPLCRADLETALSQWPHLARQAGALLRAYPAPLPGLHRLLFEGGRVCLDLIFAELEAALDILLGQPDLRVDAWYLDGFAPARNPDMWTPALFDTMATLGGPGTTFATFTAAGKVRRGLQQAGFAVEKVPGFGEKREMLRGALEQPPRAQRPRQTPWHLPKHRYPEALHRTTPPPDRVIVLGGGLAGATTASALARRGVAVSLWEAADVAGGASGNLQGVLYTRVSHRASPLNDFSLHSFCYASRLYREMLEDGQLQTGVDGELCGSLHLRPDWGPGDALFDTVASLPGLVRGVDATAAETLAGIPCDGGLFFPDSGWMHPAAVCRSLLEHPSISVHKNCGPLRLDNVDNRWRLQDKDGVLLDNAAVAVVACGTDSAELTHSPWLQLQSIRGQTSSVRSRGPLRSLKCVICHDGYLPPARQGEHCLGATFDIGDEDLSERPEDHRANLDKAAASLPALSEELQLSAVAGGRAGLRCASPDYLPVVGPVPDAESFCADYGALRRNARRVIPTAGSYQPGLYISTGHGSRGLTSTPLAGELLAAQICGEPWPLPAYLVRALSPARFLVRDLVRNRR